MGHGDNSSHSVVMQVAAKERDRTRTSGTHRIDIGDRLTHPPTQVSLSKDHQLPHIATKRADPKRSGWEGPLSLLTPSAASLRLRDGV